jgi:hypothetical protein
MFESGVYASVNRCLGWCQQCAAVQPVEKLLTDEPPRQTQSLLAQWFAELMKRKEKATVLDGVAKWRRERRAGPKCLACGSTHITDMSAANIDKNNGFAFTHPNYGGRLRESDSGDQIALRLRRRVYTPEGDFLFEEPEVRC